MPLKKYMHTYPMLSMSSLQATFRTKTTLLNTQVSINGSIPGSSGKVFPFSVGDVFAISLDVSFGESEIKNENFMACFTQANAEVIGLDITMNKVTIVNVFDSLNHLVNENEYRFE